MKLKLTIPKERLDRERDEKRRNGYPPLSDLADALYWREKGDPKPMADYVARVDAVKAQFPKDVVVKAQPQKAKNGKPKAQLEA